MSNREQNGFAEIKINDKTYKYPIYKSSQGADVIDIRKFYGESGFLTYDPGFMSTASCDSAITYIDGDKGVLLHRGYDIKDLAENCDFLEVAYLLMNGNLPNLNEFQKFEDEVTHHTMVSEQLYDLVRGFRHNAHPMAILLSSFGSLASIYHTAIDVHDYETRKYAAIKMIAKMPTLAAMAYRYAEGKPFMYPQNKLKYAENFLNMMFATPCEEYKISKVMAKALNKIFILHADHEQNASTSTVRTAGSSFANPFACISAGIASLWGPAHGGANEAVIEMLKEIKDPKNIPHFINRAKDKDDPFRLMGFGHRVYKNYDPRAQVLRETCKEILDDLGQHNNPLLHIANELEKIALNDEYFIERKLYPNVDFYSGIIYEAMNIPTNMFTVLFALARTTGWVAQWLEMHDDPDQKITRPRQLYTGNHGLIYKPISER